MGEQRRGEQAEARARVAPEVPPRPPLVDERVAALGDRLRAWRDDRRVAVVALLAVALGAGVLWFRVATASPNRAPGGGSEDPVPALAAPTAPASTATTPTRVVVHVAGAVRRPGVVTLPTGARVVDAVDAAGGPVPDADLDRLNLAAVLTDGVRILVAHEGDPPEPAAPSGPGAGPTAPTGPLDLNAATAAELDERLPGIGPTLAAAIVEERERRAGFTDVAQLRDVPGIGDRRFEQIRDLVTV